MKVFKYVLSMVVTLIMLCVLTAPSNAVTLSLKTPSTNSDGSALTDLAFVKVYCGWASGSNWTFDKKVAETVIDKAVTVDLAVPPDEGKTLYCVATAFDATGNESAVSNEVTHVFPTVAPSPPVMQGIQ